MPCQLPGGELNGISVPSICERHGGTWVAEPSLMQDTSAVPTSGTPHPTQPFMYSDGKGGYWSDKPAENLTEWLIPAAGSKKAVTKAATKLAPVVKKTVQSLFTKPGTIQKPITKTKLLPDGKLKHIGTTTKEVPGRVLSVPRASATAITAASAGKGLFGEDDATSLSPAADTTTKPNVFNQQNKDKNTPTGKEIQEIAKTGDIPKNIWEQMQTKDYWLKGVEGGSGGWDNRLFRLGEMMSYMGTPLAQRGKNPAQRWTAARSEADKVKAAIAKAQAKKDENIFGKVPTSSAKDTIITELKKEPWFLGFGKQYSEEELEAFGNKGEIIYMEWVHKGASPTQALKETLDELKLGL